MEIEKKEVAEFQGRISVLEEQALALEIKTEDDLKKATEISSQLEDISSKLTEKKESITKPLNNTLKSVRALFKPMEEAYEKAQQIVNGKALAYHQKVREDAAKAEAKIASDLEAGKIKKVETAEKRVEKIERVDNTVRTESGGLQVRKVKKYEVVDVSLLPREYLEPNMGAIWKAVQANKEIPGVRAWEEETMANVKI